MQVLCGGALEIGRNCGDSAAVFAHIGPGRAPVERVRGVTMTKLLTVLAAGVLLAACGANQASQSGGATSTSAGRTTTTATPSTGTGPAPGTAEHFIITAGDTVFFDTDRFAIKPDAATTLDRQVAWMQQFPAKAAVLEGHADERGTREYNQALGERRASAVYDYLTSRGVQAIRLATISYGELRPAVVGSNPAAWAQNRRVVTVIE